MKLSLVILAASAWVRFTTPSSGSYYLLSTCDGCSWRVEASGYNPTPVNVSASVDLCGGHRIFRVEWRADEQ